jgi:hypothetical protein
MKPTNDKVFWDTNVLVYCYDKNQSERKVKALSFELLEANFYLKLFIIRCLSSFSLSFFMIQFDESNFLCIGNVSIY